MEAKLSKRYYEYQKGSGKEDQALKGCVSLCERGGSTLAYLGNSQGAAVTAVRRGSGKGRGWGVRLELTWPHCTGPVSDET